MILIANNDPSERFTHAHAERLKECDDVRTYTECCWFCVLGYKSHERVVHAHCNSREEFEMMTSDPSMPCDRDSELYGIQPRYARRH